MKRKARPLFAPRIFHLLILAALLPFVWLIIAPGAAGLRRPFANVSLGRMISKVQKKRSFSREALAAIYYRCPKFFLNGEWYPKEPESWETVRVEAMRELGYRTNDSQRVVDFTAQFLKSNVTVQSALADAGFYSLVAMRQQQPDKVAEVLLTWLRHPKNYPLPLIIDYLVDTDSTNPKVISTITNELVQSYWDLPRSNTNWTTKIWPGKGIRHELLLQFTRLPLPVQSRSNILNTIASTPAQFPANELVEEVSKLPLADRERFFVLERIGQTAPDDVAAKAFGSLARFADKLRSNEQFTTTLRRELRNPNRKAIVGGAIARSLLERRSDFDLFVPDIHYWLTNHQEFVSVPLSAIISSLVARGADLSATRETLRRLSMQPNCQSRSEICYSYWLLSYDSELAVDTLLKMLSAPEAESRSNAAERLDNMIFGGVIIPLNGNDYADLNASNRLASKAFFDQPTKRKKVVDTLKRQLADETDPLMTERFRRMLTELTSYYGSDGNHLPELPHESISRNDE
ncbi:hypothetical protein GC207_10755 [bacterium]|nr:hypothetical protein [bacterium]